MFTYFVITLFITQTFSKEFAYSLGKKLSQDSYKKDKIESAATMMFPHMTNFGGSGVAFGSGMGFSSGYLNNGFGGLGFGGMIGGGKKGEYADKKEYDVENKNVNEHDYQKAFGAKGENGGFASQGYNADAVGVKDKVSEHGFHNDEFGSGKQSGDNEEYFGVKHKDEGAKKEEENNAKSGFKKGYTTKGFKTSSRKDEEEKSETFYDEAHDEAEDARYKGNAASYGEKENSNVKGGHEHKTFNKAEKGQNGEFVKANILDVNKEGKGHFQQQSHLNNGQEYKVDNGVGAQSVLGHQEASGIAKHYGQKIIPIYGAI